ncbi:MAG: hypothetical protein ACD_34C00126G0001 [uncultured bacterium]|nr:MAG: hypothetical protein ACD_34C00126G0001 [uncultured bacterium]
MINLLYCISVYTFIQLLSSEVNREMYLFVKLRNFLREFLQIWDISILKISTWMMEIPDHIHFEEWISKRL